MPTERHQTIVGFLYEVVKAVIGPRGGKVVFAPLRLRVRAGRFREPDLLVLVSGRDARRQDRFWLGADLVMEVVSPDDPERDLVRKRVEYAQTGVAEYWIVNPMDETITVLRLAGEGYIPSGVYPRGTAAVSDRVPDLRVDVVAVFDAD